VQRGESSMAEDPIEKTLQSFHRGKERGGCTQSQAANGEKWGGGGGGPGSKTQEKIKVGKNL